MKSGLPFAAEWRKIHRRRLRQAMRGYRALKSDGRLELLETVRNALADTALPIAPGQVSRALFGAGHTHAELIVRQYLLIRVAQLTLNRALLSAIGSAGSAVVHPLPQAWRATLEQHGFQVARWRSRVAWSGYVVLLWGYGVVSIGRRCLESITTIVRGGSPSLGRYAYLEKLVSSNLPQPGADGRSHDIITWYEQWPGRLQNLETICHSVGAAPRCSVNGVSVVATPAGVPPADTLRKLLRMIGWGVAATSLSLVDMLRGRWWHAFMLHEATWGALARLHEPDRLARDCLFHNSGWIYRPLWTYEAEKQGSRIVFYFYSTNCESFKRVEGYIPQINCWHVMNWPMCLVWDEAQADFVRRAVGVRANIQVVGPIWFQTSAQDIVAPSAASVAVFDVQPYRASRYQLLGVGREYYTPTTVNAFLSDVHAAVGARGAVMMLKRKRHIETLLHPHYTALLERLAGQPHFAAIDPGISPLRVIERSQAVISMPFTSTAVLARAAGKPSVYYDPHGLIQKDDRAAHGLPVLTGPEELRQWLAVVLGHSTSVAS